MGPDRRGGPPSSAGSGSPSMGFPAELRLASGCQGALPNPRFSAVRRMVLLSPILSAPESGLAVLLAFVCGRKRCGGASQGVGRPGSFSGSSEAMLVLLTSHPPALFPSRETGCHLDPPHGPTETPWDPCPPPPAISARLQRLSVDGLSAWHDNLQCIAGIRGPVTSCGPAPA